MSDKDHTETLQIPAGQFAMPCSRNCSCCTSWNPSDNKGKQGMGWCSDFGMYCVPKDRQGCFRHQCSKR